MKWMKATVPNLRGSYDGDLRKLDPAHFCAGIQEGGLGGWGAVFKCGQSTEQSPGTPLRYCASFGEVNGGDAWAAGFSSTTEDGSDLFDGTSDLAKDSQHAAVTFYSTNAVRMETLRLPAGMYKLTPSKSPDGWKLAVAKQDGEWNDASYTQHYLGSVELKKVASDNPPGRATSRYRLVLVLRDARVHPCSAMLRNYISPTGAPIFLCASAPDQGQEANMRDP